MALKREISKADYEKLSTELKAEYVADGDNFKLDISGDEDTGALKRAKDREAQLRRDAEKELREAKAKLDELSDGDARKRGDIETLEKSWKAKVDEADAKVAARNKQIERLTVEQTAAKIAAEISTSPALILPHIRARIAADLSGDEPLARVLDASGKVSAATLDDLKKEFVANKDFSTIIIGSKASGGGANSRDQSQRSSGAGGDSSNNSVDLSSMPASQLAERLKASREAK